LQFDPGALRVWPCWGGMLTHSLSSEEGFDGRARMVGLMARVRARHAEGSLLPFILFFAGVEPAGGNGRLVGWDVPGPGRCEWRSREESHGGAITTRVRVGVSRVGVASRPWSPPCVGVLGGMLTHSLSSEEGFDGRACMVGLMARVRARHAEGSLLPFISFFCGRRTRWGERPTRGPGCARSWAG